VDRLEAGPRRFELHVQPPPPPPAPAGGSTAARTPDFVPKVRRLVAKGPRQPPRQVDPAPVEPDTGGDGPGSGSGSSTDLAGTCVENCGDGPPADPVCGNGSVEAGEQCDDGNTASGDGCSATCRIEVKPPPPTATVAPSVLAGLRISGQTQVHPDGVTQNQMIHDGTSQVEAVVKLCIAPDGSVGSTRLLRSTRYGAYDAALIAAVVAWRYQPYRVNGTAVPACSTVRFVYTIQ
jgi:TonB family protein